MSTKYGVLPPSAPPADGSVQREGGAAPPPAGYGAPAHAPHYAHQQHYQRQPQYQQHQLHQPAVFVEPARRSSGWKAVMLVWLSFMVCLSVFLAVMAATVDDGDSDDDDDDDEGSRTVLAFAAGYTIFVTALVCLILLFKAPRQVELHQGCVVLRTTCTSYSLAFERVSGVEVWRSVCCEVGFKGCSFPRGMVTAWSDAVMIRSPDCRASIAFTPADLNRFLAAVSRSPLSGRIVYKS